MKSFNYVNFPQQINFPVLHIKQNSSMGSEKTLPVEIFPKQTIC